MKWQKWLRGLISTAISARSGAIRVIIVDPKTFNLQDGLGNVLTVAGVSALVAVVNFLQKSPLPGCNGAEDKP
jgi:hypothetical protein